MFTWESVARLGRLVRKELLEILRDRRTILTLVLMPVLLYPLLTVAFQQFILASKVDPSQGQEYRLGFASDADEAEFTRILLPDIQRVAEETSPKKTPPKFFSKTDADLEGILRAGDVDVGIRFPAAGANRKPAGDRVLDVELVYLPKAPAAIGVLNFLDRVLASRNVRLLEKRLNVPGAKEPIEVLKLQKSPLQEAGASPVVSLAALVPLILILMTITGAVYPAIDLTAGERERGTLEILVAAPVPRLGLLFAKYVSVLTVAVMTALVNLLTMTITLQLSGMGQHLFPEAGGWSAAVIVQMFGLLLLFAGFFSAVLLCLTSFARSFKEAQAYLIPLMLASLAPGIMGIMPGLKLERLAFVPLINIVLLARDLFQPDTDPVSAVLMVVVVVSTVLYALAALALAARIFGAEGVLYSEQSSWSDLLRRPREPQPAASIGGALMCLALVLPVNFVFQALVRSLLPTPASTGEGIEPTPLSSGDLAIVVAAMGIVSVLLFAIMPLLGAYAGRVDVRSGFALRWPSWLVLVGALLMGLSLWPLVLEMLRQLPSDASALAERLGPAVENLRRAGQSLRFGLMLSLAIVALAEEFFFRGYLFGALARTNNPSMTIGLTAVLFGLMHCLVAGGLGFEQLLPATLLGLVLGAIRWHTGSVLPGMALHATHNMLLSMLSQQAANWKDHVPTEYLILGAVGTALGAGLVFLAGKRQRPEVGQGSSGR